MIARPPKALAFRTAVWAGACLAAAVLVAAFWPSKRPTDYNGHSLAYWFKRLPWVNTSPNHGFAGPFYPMTSADVADRRAALAAIRAIGTNGLPFLIGKLEGRPRRSWLTDLLDRYANNWPLLRKLFPQSARMKAGGQAIAGLLALCPLPPDVEQRFRLWSLEFNRPGWSEAYYVLKASKDPKIVHDAFERALRKEPARLGPSGTPARLNAARSNRSRPEVPARPGPSGTPAASPVPNSFHMSQEWQHEREAFLNGLAKSATLIERGGPTNRNQP